MELERDRRLPALTLTLQPFAHQYTANPNNNKSNNCNNNAKRSFTFSSYSCYFYLFLFPFYITFQFFVLLCLFSSIPSSSLSISGLFLLSVFRPNEKKKLFFFILSYHCFTISSIYAHKHTHTQTWAMKRHTRTSIRRACVTTENLCVCVSCLSVLLLIAERFSNSFRCCYVRLFWYVCSPGVYVCAFQHLHSSHFSHQYIFLALVFNILLFGGYQTTCAESTRAKLKIWRKRSGK